MLGVYASGSTVEKPYEIKLINRIDKRGDDFILMRFKVTTPEQETSNIDIKFSGSFQATVKATVATVNENDYLWWSWMKITEKIDNGTLVSGETIRVNDITWAKSAKQNLDSKICEALNNDGINYYPEKRIGFI